MCFVFLLFFYFLCARKLSLKYTPHVKTDDIHTVVVYLIFKCILSTFQVLRFE